VIVVTGRAQLSGGDAFGERVRKARVYAGFSQRACAKALGCDVKTIWLWEQGKTQPQPKLFLQFARLTGVSISWLYEGVSAPLPPVEESHRASAHEGGGGRP
jgi:transcriptional regulator with XRE-family HTH domain